MRTPSALSHISSCHMAPRMADRIMLAARDRILTITITEQMSEQHTCTS